jgi:RNA-splicing ligase RtcB
MADDELIETGGAPIEAWTKGVAIDDKARAQRIHSGSSAARATAGIECRKDADVIDETPMAYEPIDKMAAQAELVEDSCPG